MKTFITTLTIVLATFALHARDYHVAPHGHDKNSGSASEPLRTLSAAARVAQPGDVITVHEGTYRERINPPRGGLSHSKRIVYRAAENEKVVIKGSERITGWEKVENDTWKVSIPDDFFGEFNPYRDRIHGDWFNPMGRVHHTGAVYVNGHWLTEAVSLDEVMKPAGKKPLWYTDDNTPARAGNSESLPDGSQVIPGKNPSKDKVRNARQETTIWAQFKGVDPNETDVEINVRQSVFYPEKPGVNYITVRGFVMEHAATPWAPPTAEQIGLIGTHWSKGWIIEENTIRYSTCVGITLGKYGDEWDNRSQSADAYNRTIERALKNGWSKESVGSHMVRNNQISHCEQAGIVGSLGAVFSTISHNEIHDIHVRRLFTGAEMAGIKIHASIDMLISNNYIHHTHRGIWLDWMAQETRVTGNLLHDNDAGFDLFVEVNHGPFLVDHNIFLSSNFLLDWSGGGAYVHNLATGQIQVRPQGRTTPFHKPHSTEVAGLHDIPGGDDRFYNNIFVGAGGLNPYEKFAPSVQMAGNVFLNGAKASRHELDPVVLPNFDPKVRLVTKADGIYLEVTLDEFLSGNEKCKLVTSHLLGCARIPSLPYEQPDGEPYCLDRDYFGKKRIEENPTPGPFRFSSEGKHNFKVRQNELQVQETQNH